ncbi:MAG: hypothetical protein ABI744_01600 [Chloroflexota bacterium]
MKKTLRSLPLALAFLMSWLAAACAAPEPAPSASPLPTPTTQPTRATSPTASPQPSALTPAQSDLDNLLAQIESTHPEPWHGVSRDEWVGQMHQLQADLSSLTPEQAYARLCELVASLSHEGRDGHQFVILPDSEERPALPFRTYEFAEGVFVTAAMPGYEELVGRRISAINGMPIDDVLAALDPLVPRDGPQTVAGFRTIFMLRTSVLRGLGLVGDGDVTVSVGGDGQPDSDVQVTPAEWPQWRAFAGNFGIALPQRDHTLYLSDPGVTVVLRTLPEAHAVYVHYQTVTYVSSDDIAAITEAVADPTITHVVLDLRQNGGGDNTTFGSLLSAMRNAAAARPGSLYVMTDRLTFSAASNLATMLEQTTDAVFAGEPGGGGLNFWDDVKWVALPHYPLSPSVGVSTRHWQFATPDDPRLAIEPDIAVPVTASDYFAGRDPALEAVLAH